MHLSEEQTQRFLHDELDARSKEALSLHVAECVECARRLAEAEREEHMIFDLLRHVDHPAPHVGAESFTRGTGTFGTWGRRVAGFVVVLALAGAAYAIPGSPLPRLVRKAAQLISGGEAPEVTPPSAPPVTSGIAVPMSARFAIVFASEKDEGSVAVSLTDGPNLVVRVVGGTATFTTDVDRLTVDNRGSHADYEVEIPRGAPFVELHLGARRLVLKDGDAFATDLRVDERGRRVLPLATH